MREKSLMVSEKLISDVYTLMVAIQLNEVENITMDMVNSIVERIEDKIKRMERHDLYTKSKTGKDDLEREKARKEYLEKAGIHPDFQY